jgi:hypothetical protein
MLCRNTVAAVCLSAHDWELQGRWEVFAAYLRPRFRELFVASIVCFVLLSVSVGVIAVCTIFVERERSPRQVIFVLSDL